MALTGVNFVRFSRHGSSRSSILAKLGDRFEVRRQALKLRWWTERHLHHPGTLFDHTYDSIKSLKGLGVYELRLDDDIGGSQISASSFRPAVGLEARCRRGSSFADCLGSGGAAEAPQRLDGK